MVSPEKINRKKAIIFSFFEIKLCGVRCKSGKNLSSQYGNAAAHLLRSSLLRVVSALVIFFGCGGIFVMDTGLSALFCSDVAYKRCRAVIVQG